MFTGLIQDLGSVVAIEPIGAGARVHIRTELAPELKPGDSIAVNGVCLTAIEPDDIGFSADAIPQTLANSTTGELAEGDLVNLELALRSEDRLGGHLVQGHVDSVAVVAWVREEDLGRRVALDIPEQYTDFVVDRGSITLNGVSLTVAEVDGNRVQVALIPETLERTTFGFATEGTRINLEVDAMAKQIATLVESYLSRRSEKTGEPA
ncbi:MAG: riboflavin synthase [Solirubrobacteraceae bacterium]|nr:riboflavin synthase [Solirubrobacteraceae bacterium]